MRNFNLETKFDVILCNNNSINHLLSLEDWENFFDMAYKHLKKDGILIFDILTIFEFENITRDFR
jgi:SAM-dependent methyltransferase